jgi:hypothetical protein
MWFGIVEPSPESLCRLLLNYVFLVGRQITVELLHIIMVVIVNSL